MDNEPDTPIDPRDVIHNALQYQVHQVDPGAIVVGWVVVFATIAAEDPNRMGFGVEKPAGQAPHSDLGMLDIGLHMTRRTVGF